MKLKALGVGTALFLSGCATFGQIQGSLQGLMGQPLAVAIQNFGYPAGQMQVGDQTVYRWSSSEVVPIPNYSTTNTFGNVGGTPFSATGSSMSMDSMSTACELDIGVSNGVMVQFSFRGQLAACQAFHVKG